MNSAPRVEFLQHGAIVVRQGAGGASLQRELLISCLAQVDDLSVLKPNESGLYTSIFTRNWPEHRAAAMRPAAMRAKAAAERREDVECADEGEDVGLDGLLRVGEQVMELVRDSERPSGMETPEDRGLWMTGKKLDAFKPTALRGILYPRGGMLHAHKDLLMGWVLSLSLGRRCKFFFGPRPEIDDADMQVVTLESGDCILLNGQKLHHGVLRLTKHYGDDEDEDNDPLPDVWKQLQAEGVIPEAWVRLNVQMRDPRMIL